jgi:hypothetical protein
MHSAGRAQEAPTMFASHAEKQGSVNEGSVMDSDSDGHAAAESEDDIAPLWCGHQQLGHPEKGGWVQ